MSDLKYGLDISEHNVIGSAQWDALRKENDFVIIRACYGTNTDKRFEEHYANAIARGFKVGLYVYSYALNVEQARSESEYLYNLAQGKQIDCGLWYDMEDADNYKGRHIAINRQTITSFCNEFVKSMFEKGVPLYGVYASQSWFDAYIDTACKRWIASWGSNSGSVEFVLDEFIHQYTSMYQMNGKRYDRNTSRYLEGGQAPINPPVSNVLKVGDIVKPTKAVSYEGVSLDAFVLNNAYPIIEIKGDRVVLGTIMTAFHSSNVVKSGSTTSGTYKVGESVRPTKAVSYEGVNLSSHVIGTYYPIIEISGNRVVLGGIVTAFHVNNVSR